VCGFRGEQLDRHNDFYAVSKTCGKLFAAINQWRTWRASAEFQKSDLSLSVRAPFPIYLQHARGSKGCWQSLITIISKAAHTRLKSNVILLIIAPAPANYHVGKSEARLERESTCAQIYLLAVCCLTSKISSN
jgi:hypothetical protein